MSTREAQKEAFGRLLDIMDELREQCPWDKKQTIETLRPLSIEETYELADAILDNDFDQIKGELGDLMLHLVFYAKIASEKKEFDIEEVLNAICDKLIHRHPHIYGDTNVSGEDEVKENWEKLKLKEGKKSVLEGVPKSLPAMIKATRIQEKARGAGFDWDNTAQVWNKLEEELQEFKDEVENQNQLKAEQEMGDLLFSVINLSRFLKIDPESALERTNKKFIKRFQFMESEAKKMGEDLLEMKLSEMDKLWNKAKDLE